MIDLFQVLIVTYAVLLDYGWVSKAKANKIDKHPTHERVWYLINDMDEDTDRHYQEIVPRVSRNLARCNRINEAIFWARQLKPKNRYEAAIQEIAKRHIVREGDWPYACSIINAFHEHQRKENKRQIF